MTEPGVSIALTPAEWRLVSSLREIPSSALKEKALELFAAVVDFARDPRCAEVQADGVPCETPSVACDQCLHVDRILDVRRLEEGRGTEAPGLVR
ncbi:MAG TPA: hypothetical protein PK598_06930 [Thermoanaerobaculia bacterium]|nr:hypothetical protein [Thermoanaerobaculia bacterium]